MSSFWFKITTFACIALLAIGGIYIIGRLNAMEKTRENVIIREKIQWQSIHSLEMGHTNVVGDLKRHVEMIRLLNDKFDIFFKVDLGKAVDPDSVPKGIYQDNQNNGLGRF